MSEVEVDFGKLKELCHQATNQHAATAFALDWAEKADNRITKLQAEVKLQSDSADYWEDEAMNHMSQAAKLQAVVDAAKALTESVDCYDNYGDLTPWNDRLKQTIKEVE